MNLITDLLKHKKEGKQNWHHHKARINNEKLKKKNKFLIDISWQQLASF